MERGKLKRKVNMLTPTKIYIINGWIALAA